MQSPPTAPAAAAKGKRSGIRTVLLVVIPIIALVGGFTWWLNGGRYVTTDNSYVGAQKSLITAAGHGRNRRCPCCRGAEGQGRRSALRHRSQPYQIALDLAKGRVAAAEVDFANLNPLLSNQAQIKMGDDTVKVRTVRFRSQDRSCFARAGTFVDRDTATASLLQAQQILEFVRRMQETTKVKLGGDQRAYRKVP